MTRLYGTKGAPRCARCAGPMVPLEGHRVHPTCEPEFRTLRAAAARAAGQQREQA